MRPYDIAYSAVKYHFEPDATDRPGEFGHMKSSAVPKNFEQSMALELLINAF
jgi:hypothetical protein